MRENEGEDDRHGLRGAKFAKKFRHLIDLCQSASKFDPLSAFKIDPPAGYGLIPVGAP
jgi:hypothetical protein